MKKIILCILSLLMFCTVCSAQTMSERVANYTYTGDSKKVAFILEIPVEYVNNEDVRSIVMDKVNDTFKEPKFEIMPFNDVQLAKITYCEEHGIPTFSNKGNMNESTLRIYDLKNIGKKLNADYIFDISLTTSYAMKNDSFFNSSSSATGRCEAKVLEVSTGRYVYQETFTAEGESTSWLVDHSSSRKAYIKAIKNCIEQINIDASTF